MTTNNPRLTNTLYRALTWDNISKNLYFNTTIHKKQVRYKAVSINQKQCMTRDNIKKHVMVLTLKIALPILAPPHVSVTNETRL